MLSDLNDFSLFASTSEKNNFLCPYTFNASPLKNTDPSFFTLVDDIYL